MMSDEQIEKLIALVREGLSASQIAAAIGAVSRHAVIGKIHRLNLMSIWPRSGNKRTPGTEPKEKKPRPPARTPNYVMQTPVVDMPVIKMDDVPPAQRRTLMQLTNRTCRWPFSDPRENGFFFCGAETHGATYCRMHAARARGMTWASRPKDYRQQES